jgi:hypothetical protein
MPGKMDKMRRTCKQFMSDLGHSVLCAVINGDPNAPQGPRGAIARSLRAEAHVGYALRRLRKQRSDLHTRVIAKEISPHAAMVKAGFRLEGIESSAQGDLDQDQDRRDEESEARLGPQVGRLGDDRVVLIHEPADAVCFVGRA